MDQIDLDLLELEEKEADCLFTFTDLNGVLKNPATMTWADIGINTEVKLDTLSHWWEIKKEEFRGLMINKARSNGFTLEALNYEFGCFVRARLVRWQQDVIQAGLPGVVFTRGCQNPCRCGFILPAKQSRGFFVAHVLCRGGPGKA